MKKAMKSLADCIAHLESAADALEEGGARREVVMDALAEVIIRTAKKGRRVSADIGTIADFLSNRAYAAMEQEKLDRSAKRKKKLGLPE